ncbi:hypothetical protein [Sinobaca sp. H24]|uniref:hypothetical protein n=1 Tax=Sinobaca sp. H24 TaxID=2923376 RepID=UPI00207AAB34|nr:hypothetical protein [Sinobaca sp. H24]
MSDQDKEKDIKKDVNQEEPPTALEDPMPLEDIKQEEQDTKKKHKSKIPLPARLKIN